MKAALVAARLDRVVVDVLVVVQQARPRQPPLAQFAVVGIDAAPAIVIGSPMRNLAPSPGSRISATGGALPTTISTCSLLVCPPSR
jgi:hypothetical protein